MTSMTTSQQTDRSGADEIPGPRSGQGVRLLVLGADSDAQDLRDQAQAAGYELAQRYSARVSHVAYGPGIDPEDARYAKIRDSGLALLPLQKCAEALGLRADAVGVADVADPVDVAGPVDVADGADAADVDVAEAVEAEVEVAIEPESELVPEAETEVEVAAATEPDVEAEVEIDDEPLDFPPLHTASDEASDESIEPEALEQTEEPQELEHADELDELESSEKLYDHEVENAFVPGLTEEHADLDVPLAAVVIGVDPWEGEGEQTASAEPVQQPEPHSESDSSSDANPDSGLGRVLLSLLWALIPLATFGLLTPVTFGYAAYRLRSRGLGLTTLVYTLAVVVSFVLSAIRPHAVTPADTTGALLTVCLAGTWIGGTLHALSLRTRVFAR